jgi:hypothetical protein
LFEHTLLRISDDSQQEQGTRKNWAFTVLIFDPGRFLLSLPGRKLIQEYSVMGKIPIIF